MEYHTSTTTTIIQTNRSPVVQTISPVVQVKKGFVGDIFKGFLIFLPNLIDLAFGLGTIVWIYYLIKIPWGLYFSARKGRIDGQESRELGIVKDAETIEKLKTIENRLLITSLAAHCLSALGVYGFSYITGGQWIKPHTALLFLGSAVVRPAWETHIHVRTRIEQLLRRIQYPKPHVEQLLNDVSTLEQKEPRDEENIKRLQKEHEEQVITINSREESDIKRYMDKHSSDVNRVIEKEVIDISGYHEHLVILDKKIKDLESAIRRNNEKTVQYFDKIENQFFDSLKQLNADNKMIEDVRSFLKSTRENIINK